MNPNAIGITTATIHFYETPFHYLNPDKWVWTIKFENAPMFIPHNRIHFNIGFYEEEATKAANAIKDFFARNFIFEGSTVAVIYVGEQVIAIGKSDEDRWIDVRDLKVKTFAELKLTFNSLVVKF